MRVCQFRHYGTVFYAPHRWPEHADRELLVLQTERRLSIARALLPDFVAVGETSVEKKRLLLQEGYILTHARTENPFVPGPVER
jgi:hypothetical protein